MSAVFNTTERWLSKLGYDDTAGVVLRSEEGVSASHPYAREMKLMLDAEGEIRSSAIFEVDQVPAVCFIDISSEKPFDSAFISEIRQKIWNQNLVSIVIVVQGENATAYPVPKHLQAQQSFSLDNATSDGVFSANEITSGAIYSRLPDWFERKYRIDRVLQDNLCAVVELLIDLGLSKEQAQLLLGKCIFVSYLEHRQIVGDKYREFHGVESLLKLLTEQDGEGLHKLFKQLKQDFNGDLLEVEGGDNTDWRELSPKSLDLLAQFLLQTHIRGGQKALWPYDFKYIPVELISGIYESFLGDDQRNNGAFYTPRNLATLAIDEAFRGITAPWEEVVLDGACGSGILLTSAYRRMLGAKRASQRGELSYQDRRDILLKGIRGSDISLAACKVTVFSLYLALLEDLAPADIVQLQEDQSVKLPELIGTVIASEQAADFFDSRNRVAQSNSASIIISNPPWFEPSGEGVKPYEHWWKKKFGKSLPRRQIALAFARRATETLRPGGRLCLILPASTLAAMGSNAYLKSWFEELSPERIYNLADIFFLLFDGAVHPATIVTGVRRQDKDIGRIPPREVFEYFVPKGDVSLAFGRLSVHSSDRKKLPTHAVCDDSEILRTYFWGNEVDESLIARLRLTGTIRDHSKGKSPRFVICKGFHMTDGSKGPIPPDPLKPYPFLLTGFGKNNAYPKDRLFITDGDLIDFPDTIETVADYGSKDGKAFKGTRVIFPDGAKRTTLEVRACFTDKPLCFTQTVGAIVDVHNDEALMLFMTAYLRSKLASYLLFYTTFSLSMERPHVKLKEIENLPFLLPEDHESPEVAQSIVNKVAELLRFFKDDVNLNSTSEWIDTRAQVDDLVCDYFGLSQSERQVVRDTCEYFIPSRQPASFASLHRPLHQFPTNQELNSYQTLLQKELEVWRDKLGGSGTFSVQLTEPKSSRVGSVGMVRVSLEEAATPIPDLAPVARLMSELRVGDIYPLSSSEGISVASDFMVYLKPDYVFVKPMIRRLWLGSAAVHDAYRIVSSVRSKG